MTPKNTHHTTQDDSFAISRANGRIQRHREPDGAVWYDGDVVTLLGIVSVYSDATSSRYDVAMAGRHYIRNESRGRTERGLAIQATKFARECSFRHSDSGR